MADHHAAADAAATLALAPPVKMSSMDAFVRNMLLEVADGAC